MKLLVLLALLLPAAACAACTGCASTTLSAGDSGQRQALVNLTIYSLPCNHNTTTVWGSVPPCA